MFLWFLLTALCVNVSGQNTTSNSSVVDTLRGKSLRVFVITGPELIRNSDNVTFSGWIGRLFMELATVGGFTWNETRLGPEYERNISLGLTSKFDACPLNVRNGNLDVCVGNIFETAARELISPFTSALHIATFQLVTSAKTSTATEFTSIFDPFTWQLWLCLIGVVILNGVAYVAVEREPGGDFESKDKPLHHHLKDSLFLALVGIFNGAPLHAPKTTGGQLIGAGFSLLILVSLSFYTAQLAALLTVSGLTVGLSSLEDAQNKGIKVSVPSVIAPAVSAVYTSLSMIQTITTEQTFDLLQQNVVLGSILQSEAFLLSQATNASYCGYAPVGSVVTSVPLAFPTSNTYVHALSALISAARFDGRIAEWIKDYTPPRTACDAASSVSAADPLNPQKLSGALLITGCCTILGVMVWVITMVVERRSSRRGDKLGLRAPSKAEIDHEGLAMRDESMSIPPPFPSELQSFIGSKEQREIDALGTQLFEMKSEVSALTVKFDMIGAAVRRTEDKFEALSANMEIQNQLLQGVLELCRNSLLQNPPPLPSSPQGIARQSPQLAATPVSAQEIQTRQTTRASVGAATSPVVLRKPVLDPYDLSVC